MLDDEKFAPEADVGMELRHTNVKLRNNGDLSDVIQSSVSAEGWLPGCAVPHFARCWRTEAAAASP